MSGLPFESEPKQMNSFFERLQSWNKARSFRKDYCTLSRIPFYDIAGRYLPDDNDAIVVDIGAGTGGFAEHLDLANRYSNLYLLDGNQSSVEILKRKFTHAICHSVPEPLPFEDNAVHYVHCSHMVEHLYHAELYSFLKELDRVLDTGGILIISSPLLWEGFYSDLSHVKPYTPDVFLRYLTATPEQASAASISQSFSKRELVYRYSTAPFHEWGSRHLVVDFLIRLLSVSVRACGVNTYVKNGYTLVLQKT